MQVTLAAIDKLENKYPGDAEPPADDVPMPTEYPESADGEPVIMGNRRAEPKAAARGASYNGFAFQRFDEMRGTIAKRHLIKGVFARGETSAWIAPPGGMKSALMASAAIAVASGTDWFGKRNKEACGVVYFALERPTSYDEGSRLILCGWIFTPFRLRW